MYVFLAILIVLAAILLIGAVLIQKSKGGGLASNYAGANNMMGYRKTTDFIEKATWSLAIIICVLSIACSFSLKAPHAESAVKAPAQTEAAAPGTGAATTQAAAPAAKPAAQAPAAKPAAAPAAQAPAAPAAK